MHATLNQPQKLAQAADEDNHSGKRDWTGHGPAGLGWSAEDVVVSVREEWPTAWADGCNYVVSGLRRVRMCGFVFLTVKTECFVT